MARCIWRFCAPPDTMVLPHCAAPDGDRTHDHTLTERMLCQLSYRGVEGKWCVCINVPLPPGTPIARIIASMACACNHSIVCCQLWGSNPRGVASSGS